MKHRILKFIPTSKMQEQRPGLHKWLSSGTSCISLSSGISLRVNLFGYLILEPYYAIPWQNGGLKNASFGFNFTPGWQFKILIMAKKDVETHLDIERSGESSDRSSNEQDTSTRTEKNDRKTEVKNANAAGLGAIGRNDQKLDTQDSDGCDY